MLVRVSLVFDRAESPRIVTEEPARARAESRAPIDCLHLTPPASNYDAARRARTRLYAPIYCHRPGRCFHISHTAACMLLRKYLNDIQN